MKKATEKNMLEFIIAESGELISRFLFPEDFIGFQGHFPGNRILPGICQIQCVITMLEKWKGCEAVLQEIISAKFLSPVLPSEELLCTGHDIKEKDNEVIIKALLSRNGKKISELKLRVLLK